MKKGDFSAKSLKKAKNARKITAKITSKVGTCRKKSLHKYALKTKKFTKSYAFMQDFVNNGAARHLISEPDGVQFISDRKTVFVPSL